MPSPFYDRQRAERAQEEALANAEAASQAGRWALSVAGAIEADRLARQGTNGLNAGDRLEDLIGCAISGDHRPPIRRRAQRAR